MLRQLLSERLEVQPAPEYVSRRRANQEARDASPYVFSSWGKCGHITESKGTMLAVSKEAGIDLGRHDLRRTLEDVATACHVSDDQRRQLLNHLASDVHGQHYANNPDPKVLAAAVERIAQWVITQAEIASPSNVVSLSSRAA